MNEPQSENPYRKKLTERDVIMARQIYQEGKAEAEELQERALDIKHRCSIRTLAVKFCVSESAMRAAVMGRAWAHIDEHLL